MSERSRRRRSRSGYRRHRHEVALWDEGPHEGVEADARADGDPWCTRSRTRSSTRSWRRSTVRRRSARHRRTNARDLGRWRPASRRPSPHAPRRHGRRRRPSPPSAGSGPNQRSRCVTPSAQTRHDSGRRRRSPASVSPQPRTPVARPVRLEQVPLLGGPPDQTLNSWARSWVMRATSSAESALALQRQGWADDGVVAVGPTCEVHGRGEQGGTGAGQAWPVRTGRCVRSPKKSTSNTAPRRWCDHHSRHTTWLSRSAFSTIPPASGRAEPRSCPTCCGDRRTTRTTPVACSGSTTTVSGWP